MGSGSSTPNSSSVPGVISLALWVSAWGGGSGFDCGRRPGHVSWALFSLRLVLLEHSHPCYKEQRERLFTKAAICIWHREVWGPREHGMCRLRKGPAVSWQPSCHLGGLGSTPRLQPHSCLLFSGCGPQDPWWQASCLLRSTGPSPFSGKPPQGKGDGRGGGALGQASGPGAAPLALMRPAWSALAPFGAPEQDVEPALGA